MKLSGLLLCEILVEHGCHFAALGGAAGHQRGGGAAGDDFLADSPLHGGKRPCVDASGVGILAQIGGTSQVAVLIGGVGIQDQGKLLTGDATHGVELVAAHTADNLVGCSPDYCISVPLSSCNIGEGGGASHGGLAVDAVKNGNKHRSIHGGVRRKGGGGGAAHVALFDHGADVIFGPVTLHIHKLGEYVALFKADGDGVVFGHGLKGVAVCGGDSFAVLQDLFHNVTVVRGEGKGLVIAGFDGDTAAGRDLAVFTGGCSDGEGLGHRSGGGGGCRSERGRSGNSFIINSIKKSSCYGGIFVSSIAYRPAIEGIAALGIHGQCLTEVCGRVGYLLNSAVVKGEVHGAGAGVGIELNLREAGLFPGSNEGAFGVLSYHYWQILHPAGFQRVLYDESVG